MTIMAFQSVPDDGDDSARLPFAEFPPTFPSPFQANSNSGGAQSITIGGSKLNRRGRARSKPLHRSPSNTERNTLSSFSLNLPEFNFSPEAFAFGAKSAVAGESSEKQEVDQQQEALTEQPESEPSPKSLPLISVSRVLYGIPQSPHFWPLRNCSDLARRLLMEAWDRVFVESAEKIQRLEANGFWAEAGKVWKTLEELQGMGYNVIVLRRRLVELADVVMEKRGFMNEIKGLANKAEFHRMEKTRLENEIVKLKALVEGEEMKFDDLMGTVEKMEGRIEGFDDDFGKLVMKPLEVNWV